MRVRVKDSAGNTYEIPEVMKDDFMRMDKELSEWEVSRLVEMNVLYAAWLEKFDPFLVSSR